jgi:hypothetical protein
MADTADRDTPGKPFAAHDQQIREAEQAAQVSERAQARFADLFDIRRVIAGLFLLYGLVLTVLGLGASDADIARAADVNANLWTGLAMLAFGALMLAWALLHPVGSELVEGSDDPDRRDSAHAPAPTGVEAAALSDHARGPSGRDDDRTPGRRHTRSQQRKD